MEETNNMKSKGTQLSAMLIVMLLISMAFVPAVSAKEVNEKKSVDGLDNIKYTPAELNSLYSKYDITENDIKFAKEELPHFRKGTVLDGNTRVISTETGEAPEGLIEGVDYDTVISISDMISIEEDAREKYLQKYDVDPANPKVKIVNGIPLPKEEANRLIKSKQKGTTEPEPLISILAGPSDGPHAIQGKIIVKIFEARDSKHKPTEAYTSATYDAINRFEPMYNVDMEMNWYFGLWDASDEGTDTHNVLDDLQEDMGGFRNNAENVVLLGWAHKLTRNGMAHGDGFETVCSDVSTDWDSPDWPHDSIVQHELSHLFNAADQGTKASEHPTCIMNYGYAYWGTNIWCNSCASTVSDNIWGN
ncbi:MAG: hypothetical protein M8352_01080 [ANME-2 cluster archaeon]|nr:hypothetical protein [ANME-2 cluster archaeon]MCL7474619.1 hypothetical protein [ANME-2 cluster archaeon]